MYVCICPLNAHRFSKSMFLEFFRFIVFRSADFTLPPLLKFFRRNGRLSKQATVWPWSRKVGSLEPGVFQPDFPLNVTPSSLPSILCIAWLTVNIDILPFLLFQIVRMWIWMQSWASYVRWAMNWRMRAVEWQSLVQPPLSLPSLPPGIHSMKMQREIPQQSLHPLL